MQNLLYAPGPVIERTVSLEYFEQLWEQFMAFLAARPPGLIYFFLFLSAFMENVVPPIPGDTLIVFGAYLAGVGTISVMPAYLAMWAGSALGCLLIYALAYWKGRALFARLNSRIFSDAHLAQAESWFERYGDRIVIFNRFLPTVRAFVGVVAGISRMRPWRMVLYVLLGTFLWNTLLVYFGLKVGENWRLVLTVLKTYNRAILGLMVAGGIGYWLWRRKKKRAQEAELSAPEDGAEQVDRRA